MHFSCILNTLSHLGFDRALIIIAISALPVIEIRGALPLAINIFHFSWQYALLLAVIGNLIPVPLLLFSFDAISQHLSQKGIFKRWLDWLNGLAQRRGKAIERYKRFGLMLLVAVPLPVTGAWTGSLVAAILNVHYRHAFLSILAGVCVAGAIITAICILAGGGI